MLSRKKKVIHTMSMSLIRSYYCFAYWIFLVPSAVTIIPTAYGLAPYFVGFDLGTSGIRISILQPVCEVKQDDKAEDSENAPREYSPRNFEEVHAQAMIWRQHDDPEEWWQSVLALLEQASQRVDLKRVASVAVSGTSASCLLIDRRWHHGKMTRERPRMYNYDVRTTMKEGDEDCPAAVALHQIDRFAPPKHTARSPTGTLAKLLTWHKEQPLTPTECLCHQADYLAFQLLYGNGRDGNGDGDDDGTDFAITPSTRTDHPLVPVVSDWHNCLKLGYDVQQLQWPDWLQRCLTDTGLDCGQALPQNVVSPGEILGTISASVAMRTGLKVDTRVVAGTTDSNAAFLAATEGMPRYGTAVTSLGSTLAIKVLSRTYIEDATLGVYSHRMPLIGVMEGQGWLVGGASNVGCAILRHYAYSVSELEQLSADIDPNEESPYFYYPLVKRGERFPVADSEKEPILHPIPKDRGAFLHGLLQGISTVERDGYTTLQKLGVDPPLPHVVYTSGGGARNPTWTIMRQRRLREVWASNATIIPASLFTVKKALHTEPSYGVALLAAAMKEDFHNLDCKV